MASAPDVAPLPALPPAQSIVADDHIDESDIDVAVWTPMDEEHTWPSDREIVEQAERRRALQDAAYPDSTLKSDANHAQRVTKFGYDQYVLARGNFLLTQASFTSNHKADIVWIYSRAIADMVFDYNHRLELSWADITKREGRLPIQLTTRPRDPVPTLGAKLPTSRTPYLEKELKKHFHSAPSSKSTALVNTAPAVAKIDQPTKVSTPPSAPQSDPSALINTAPAEENIDRLAKASTPPVPPSQAMFRTAPGVGALKNRPLEVPVKEQKKRKRTQKAVETDDPDAKELADKETMGGGDQPPAKRTRKQLSNNQATVASNMSPGRHLINPGLKQVINGLALPVNRDEADRAHSERKRLLLERLKETPDYRKGKAAFDKKKSTAKATKGKGKAKAVKGKKMAPMPHEYAPDIMPEFFETSNFDPNPKIDDVRCVCCALDEPEDGQWIACSTCNAWQHNACMGKAVPANVNKDPYWCHVCDPWGHRELLQSLRKADQV